MSNLWNVQGQNKTYQIQQDYVNHYYKLKNAKYAI